MRLIHTKVCVTDPGFGMGSAPSPRARNSTEDRLLASGAQTAQLESQGALPGLQLTHPVRPSDLDSVRLLHCRHRSVRQLRA